MKILFNQHKDLKVCAVFEDLAKCKNRQALADNGLFQGKKDTSYQSLDLEGKGKIWYGLGSFENLKEGQLIHSFKKLSQLLKQQNLTSFELKLPDALKENERLVLKALEGFLQDEYQFNTYKTEKEEKKELEIALEASQDLEESYYELVNLIEGVNTTRELVNLPANDLYPETLAQKVREIFEGTEVEVEILNKEEIQALGMEAYLQVARGSAKEPKFIILRYMPVKDSDEHLTFVGKGLTYDSGGYALKPAASMVTMKCDMAGAGSVIGLMVALEKNKVQKNVVSVIAAAENLISGDAYKNGDIISSMKGTTIEVGNTDAEGRLTLADAIYYAATKLNSTAVIDLATLTGACVVALGEKTTGMLSNDDELANKMLESAKAMNENLHRFTAFEEHYEQIKGKQADLKNSTTGGAGSITAGLFLEHFVESKPWIHLDIAGPAHLDSAWGYHPAGASGNPVKTIYDFVTNY